MEVNKLVEKGDLSGVLKRFELSLRLSSPPYLITN